MPVNNPIRGVRVQNTTASGTLDHGQPVAEGNFVGVAVKQLARGWEDGLDVQATIEDDEFYYLITKGEVQVPFVTGFAKGDAVYIDGSNVLTETNTGNLRFGRVTAIENTEGVPDGYVRIDLDDKSAVAADAF